MTIRREVAQEYVNGRPFYAEGYVAIGIVGYGQKPACPEMVVSVSGEKVILERVHIERDGRVHLLN